MNWRGRLWVTALRRSHADIAVAVVVYAVTLLTSMPDLDGLAATRLITGDPELAGVRVLILTTFEIDEYVFQALRAGASGFLGKSAETDEPLDAIRTVHRGDALLCPAATKALVARFLARPEPVTPPAHELLATPPTANARSSPWSPPACPTRRSRSGSWSAPTPRRPTSTAP